jgi:ATP-binding cassette subfamily E protein 1
MADDSIAVVDLDRCQPDRCNYECANYCPPNRTGKECIVRREERFGEETPYAGGPQQIHISEEVCLGETCGICVEKCPFDAIEIINLPTELEDDPAHRYGENAFALYGLPIPQAGEVTGILGPNGIGKTTAVRALTGAMVPNLGILDASVGWEEVIDAYRGTELQPYLIALADEAVSIAQKPQYVDQIPREYDGTAADLLASTDERGALAGYIDRLGLEPVLETTVDRLSGGELQRVALAATLARDREFYFLDEISPYLDIGQRVTAARLIDELATETDAAVLVVEHDLALLDLLADRLHIGYGRPGAFGVITPPKSTRAGINEYLKGYLSTENMRIRPSAITFEEHAPRESVMGAPLVDYAQMAKSYDGSGFGLEPGQIHAGEVLGVVGPNGIGKSTFAKLITGEIAPDSGQIEQSVPLAYKPQYVEADTPIRVEALLQSISTAVGTSIWQTEIGDPLQLERLMDRMVTDLSGGERQRVAIAGCLSTEAQLYVLDEPSAHLDVEQRIQATTAIRRFAENNDKSVLVIDHDIYMIDLLADRLVVFDGEPAVRGHAAPPQSMRAGMNEFLEQLAITFRRDERTSRPRINKPDSQLDRTQKAAGEYYYAIE